MKIGRVANLRMGDSIITFLYKIDHILIYYSSNDDMTFWYQTRSENCETWHKDKFWNLGIYH